MRRHRVLFLNALPEFHGHTMAKDVLGFLVQQDAENLVVNQAFGKFGGAAQNFLHVQSGVRFAADFVEQQQRLGLILLVLEKPRVFNRRADAAGDQHQNILLVGREVIQLAAFDIEHPDHAPTVQSAEPRVRSERCRER